VPNVKPKAAVGVLLVGVEVLVAETVAEPDGVPVAGVESELDAESGVEGRAEPVGIGRVARVLATSIPPEEVVVAEVAGVESELDADAGSEVEGKAEPVGIGRVARVLATSIPPEEVAVAVEPDAAVAAAAQSVADTVTVDTTVTVTMLSVPMTTVGVTIPFVAEEDVVGEVSALDVILLLLLGMELETTDVGLRVDDEVTAVGVDEDDRI